MILEGYIQSLLLDVRDSRALTEDAIGHELLYLLLGEDFELLVNDKHHIFAVRNMVETVCFLDGTLEAETEDEVFYQSEHITIGF